MVTNICSMQIPYVRFFLYLCWNTILPKVFFVNFIYPPSWLFPHIDSKKVCTLIKRSVTKFPVISAIQYTLAFITSFFEGMFSQSRDFYENNMILWYYQIRPKVVWKVHGAWIDGYDSPNKDKNITITKIKSLLFFYAMFYSKNHVIPHPVIAAILNNITTLKNNNYMPVKFSKYNPKHQI